MKNFLGNHLPTEEHKAETEEFTVLSNGIQMPMVGLGVMHMHGNECVRAICEAMDAGYRMIDTAAIYGNEAAVGNGIRDSGIDRENLFVTTKLWVQDVDERHARMAYEKSLKNLGLEYVDLFLIHQPLGDIYGAWRAMEKLYEEGKVRAIGVSNLNSGRLVDLSMHNRITPHVNQVEIHPFYSQEKAVQEMKNLGVQPEGWAPFAVVPKSSNPSRIRENYDVWDFRLTKEDVAAIQKMEGGRELFFEHDSPELARMFGNYRIH